MHEGDDSNFAETDVQRDVAQLVRNGKSLLGLYRRCVPQGPLRLADADVFCVATLARAHYTLETVLSLRAREIDSIVLARSLYEHVATLAWLCIDASTHYPMFLRWEREQREKMLRDLERHGVATPTIDIRRALINAGRVSAPETPDRAVQADSFWSRVGLDWEFSFRRSYANLFRPYSAYVHPTAMGLASFIGRSSDGPRVHEPPTQFGDKVAAYSVTTFADALVVMSHRFGWPAFHDVVFAYGEGLATSEEQATQRRLGSAGDAPEER